MTHWRKALHPSQFLGAHDLGGRDVTVEIAHVGIRECTVDHGAKEKFAVIEFAKASKPWIVNVTNCETIAKMHGDDYESWVGKRITLFESTTKFKGETVPCVRVRPKVPAPPKEASNAG